MQKLLAALQFLTIFRLKEVKNISEKEIGGSSAYFPIVGLFEGLVLAGVSIPLMRTVPSDVTAVILILFSILLNAGLHLDGLSDTFDAIASHEDRQRKLEIMKDGNIGAFGVVAIVIALLLKYLMLKGLMGSSPLRFYFALVFMPVFARWAMVATACHGRPVRKEGLGYIFATYTKTGELLVSAIIVVLIFFVLFPFMETIINEHVNSLSKLLLFASDIIFIYIFSLIAVWFSNKHYGGITGDILGAVHEGASILFLFKTLAERGNLTLWSQGFIS